MIIVPPVADGGHLPAGESSHSSSSAGRSSFSNSSQPAQRANGVIASADFARPSPDAPAKGSEPRALAPTREEPEGFPAEAESASNGGELRAVGAAAPASPDPAEPRESGSGAKGGAV